MRILLLNQFYPPDPAPTGIYLRYLGRALAARGHEVKVLCSSRSYDGTQRYASSRGEDGVEVTRLPAMGFGRKSFVGKLADYGSFYAILAGALMLSEERPDVILSLTTPPYIGLLGKLAAWRHGARHAHWVMDLYPNVMSAHQMARADSLLYRFLASLTKLELRGSHAIIALGDVMAERVGVYTDDAGQTSHVTAMPLWSDPSLQPWDSKETNPLRKSRNWSENETVFLYSGNMGLGHRLGEFLETARTLGSSGPRWVFSGGGKRRCEVEAFVASNTSARVELMDYVPDNLLRAHLAAADVHIASLDSRWQGLIVPSKLQASFAMGRPVVYVGGEDCETAIWIKKSGGGWVVKENDLDGLLAAVRQAMEPQVRLRRGQAALAFATQHFNATATCARLAEVLEGRTTERAQPGRQPVKTIPAAATK